MKNTKRKPRRIGLLIGCTLLFLAALFVCFFIPENTFGAEDTESNEDGYGSFEEQLANFPEYYHPYLETIHENYPNYIFQADYVDFSFDEAVYQETIGHRKLVNMKYDGVSWRSLSSACYDPETNTWSTFSGNWTDAGIDVIEYYLDPRNFLSLRHMYIFAQQTYTGFESREGVASIAGDSFLSGEYTDSTGTHSYIDTIMQVAEESGVSPYVIAATIRQEQPASGESALIDGSKEYYNFFNFGAAGSDVIANGIAHAKRMGWDTVYKSILGGAKSYYNGYLRFGQDTYFYKDYNVINGDFDHQYAQCAYDQIGNASFLRNAIGGDPEAVVVLRIPVYTDMPLTKHSYPPETDQLNSRYLEAQITLPGDVDGDGILSGQDYIAVKNHILRKKIITDEESFKAADVNGDGMINALDYVKIKELVIEQTPD